MSVPRITGGEKAANTALKHTSVVASYDRYVLQLPTPLPVFSLTTASIFCNHIHIQEFAYYLVHDYTKATGNKDETLMESTILGYISTLMSSAKTKFNDVNPEFFKVLGGRSSSVPLADNWYMQMDNGISNAITRRSIEAGEELEQDAPELPRNVMFLICAAYFAHGVVHQPARPVRYILGLGLEPRVRART